jgi:hypothetical protein
MNGINTTRGEVNEWIKTDALTHNEPLIDLWTITVNPQDKLRLIPAYTFDELHLTDNGYSAWYSYTDIGIFGATVDHSVTITTSSNSVSESDTTITLTATMANVCGYYSNVTITTADNTATQPDDYTAINQVLTFLPGQTTQTVLLSINRHADNKPPKSFIVALSNPTGNATLGSPSSVEINIVNEFIGSSDKPGTIGVLIAFITAILGIFPAIVDLIVSAGVLAVVTILAGVLFTFIAKLKLGW